METIIILNKKAKAKLIILAFLWSWGESNSRPNIFLKSFLHVYCCIICRRYTGTTHTNISLSWMVL